MPCLSGGVHQSAQRDGVSGSADDQPNDDTQDDERQQRDPEGLVNEQHFGANVPRGRLSDQTPSPSAVKIRNAISQ